MTMDITPTAIAAAGGAPPPADWFDGRDILPLAGRRAASPHESILVRRAQG
jgi:arylsulfatase A-like enzyme